MSVKNLLTNKKGKCSFKLPLDKNFKILDPGPHLIEQEVQSARIILRTIIDIYLSSENCEEQNQELGQFIKPWISRYRFNLNYS